jgi:hypothetical protein
MLGASIPALAGPLSLAGLRDLARTAAPNQWGASSDALLARGTATVATMPVPSLVVGYDDSRAAVPPFALPHWERLGLEPYGAPRHVQCVALVPDSPHLMAESAAFLREVACAYQLLRLGTHAPLARKNMGLRDEGIWPVAAGDATGTCMCACAWPPEETRLSRATPPYPSLQTRVGWTSCSSTIRRAGCWRCC